MLVVSIFLGLLTLHVDGKPWDGKASTCGYDSCVPTTLDTLNVHLVPHSHDDVGWLKTVDQYYFQDVQNLIGSVVSALGQNAERKFVQVETAFFKKWWVRQSDATKDKVRDLVSNGQLEIIGGAWSMNDEAAVHYQSTIDQFTLGLRYLEDNLGKCARPRVGWQIDPFGHSREHASISAQLGFDSLFFARVDYRDKSTRLDRKTLDMIWRGSANLGNSSDIFTSVLYKHYSAPAGFCFDIVCSDEPIIVDEESPDYNYERRVQEFASIVSDQADHFQTNNILIPMGDDFRYEAAMTTYINLDRLIKGFDLFQQKYKGKTIKVFYSTPSCYAKSVNDYVIQNNYQFEIKTDDFFPFADTPQGYLTGYYTSRPASKRYERIGNNLLQVVKQLAVAGQISYYNEAITSLKEAMGIIQHHDAITGTEHQDVTWNYHLILAKAIRATNTVTDSVLSWIMGSNTSYEFDSCLLSNVSICSQTDSESFTVVVYNPISHPVSTAISLPVDSTGWTILDPDENELTFQVNPSISDFGYITDGNPKPNVLTFFARDVPQLGFKVYRVRKSDRSNEASKTNNLKIGYEEINIEIDDETGLLKSVTMNGQTLDVKQELLYYTSESTSGSYVFLPNLDVGTTPVNSDKVITTTIEGDIYQGVIQEFSSWAKQIIKIYNDDRSYIEFEWLIGPIDTSDGIGKEVISRFTTSLNTDHTFYTDSNGREMMQRIKDYRSDYNYTDERPISGNYYPVPTRIVLKDEDQGLELAVLTDRAEGGASLENGQLEFMVHRSCLNSDFGERLNETEYSQGLTIRGHHYLILGPSSGNGEKSLAAVQRDVAQRKTLEPWTFISASYLDVTPKHFSLLNAPLPDNVQILSLEPWNDSEVLLRFEHVLEKDEDENLSRDVTVDLSNLFSTFTINELRETTLAGNIPIEENVRLHWPGSDAVNSLRLVNSSNENIDDLQIKLTPMQIRTFIAKISYNT